MTHDKTKSRNLSGRDDTSGCTPPCSPHWVKIKTTTSIALTVKPHTVLLRKNPAAIPRRAFSKKQHAQSHPQTQKQTMPGPRPTQPRQAVGVRFPEILWRPIPYHLAQNDRPRRRSLLPEKGGAHLFRRTVPAFEMLSRCKEPEEEMGGRL